MRFRNCLSSLAQAAGRDLTDDEVGAIFERVHKAALDIKAGRPESDDLLMYQGKGDGKALAGLRQSLKDNRLLLAGDDLIQQAAKRAAAELEAEAARAEMNAYRQLLAINNRRGDVNRLKADDIEPLKAVELMIRRDYSGRVNIASFEQMERGWRDYLSSKVLDSWEALGKDYLGFFQDRTKMLELIREIRGEDTGNALAKKGAESWHQAAEEARQAFNKNGGNIGRLDDWGMPQHWSQERVAAGGRDAFIDHLAGPLTRTAAKGKYYVDDLTGQPWNEAQLRDFLGHAYDTISTNGHNNQTPGQMSGSSGKAANRHDEHRQIHFPDAESQIDAWDTFGNKTLVEILDGHVKSMARDIALTEYWGPNPDLTYRTIRDSALKESILADRENTGRLETDAKKLDRLFDYAAGKRKATVDQRIRKIADGIANLNVAGKLGSSMITSLFGDKPMLEAVSHMNNIPAYQRWMTELSGLDPTNASDRRLLQRQGLMLDSVRSQLQRFGEDLGQSSATGKLANATMRLTGMDLVNEGRKGGFGIGLMSSIGHELASGKAFADLESSDVRALRHLGITEADWNTWKLAKLDDVDLRYTSVPHVLTPETIGAISDDALRQAGIIGAQAGAREAAAARRTAIVKLLGAVNTESEFAIVTPGYKERAQFYGGLASERGTVPGEIWRSILQFKSFPWTFLGRGMDAVANMDGPSSKAAMTAYIIASTTLAGAMIMQTKEVLGGKDPRKMFNGDWYKFWGSAFIGGGALGFYGDFLYSVNQNRYGSGPLEALSGPTMGPLLELALVQPLNAAKNHIEGKKTHLAAQTLQDLKGFVPMNNAWYAKAALDHLVWQQVMERLSPGYLTSIRRKTAKEYHQDFWYQPGEFAPDRLPDLGAAFAK